MSNRAGRLGFTSRYLGRTRPSMVGVHIENRDARHVAMVDGVRVEVPNRVSGNKRDILRPIDEDDQPIALLLGTRHQNGYIREASVVTLVERAPWFAEHFPFLLLAVGDYVYQVSDRAAAELLSWDRDELRYLAVANPALMALVRARSLSYGVGVDATTRLAELVAQPDWFSGTLASGATPTWDEFDRRTDARFPYFNNRAWRSAVALGPASARLPSGKCSTRFSVLRGC